LFAKQPVWWEGLTGRRRLFVEYYCTDRACFCNAAAAYAKAFGSNKKLSDSSIQSNSSRMARDPKVKAAIARLLRSRQNEEDRITEFQALELLKTLSFYNPKDIVDEHGNLKGGLEGLGPLAVCVAGIKRGRHGKEVKLFDRTKSLAMLCNYLDITRPAEGNTVINPVVLLTDKDVDSLREEGAKAATEDEAEYEVMEAGEE
jgi:phage terminase small subunit